MRKTKIICTIGPACEDEETLTKMCMAGMNVARLNFSHGTHEEHKKKIELIKTVRERLGLPIAIMLDTKGPEYRIGMFENKSVRLKEGDRFIFTTDDVVGNAQRVSVNYKHLTEELSAGDMVTVNNGLVVFHVDHIEKNNVVCTVQVGGVLSDKKSMSFPNKVLHHAFLSEQDKSDLIFGLETSLLSVQSIL